MIRNPISSATQVPGATLFERYLEEVKTSMQLNQLQLTSSAISMERCRNAIEWQQAVHQQFSVITKAFNLNVSRLNDWGRVLLSQPQVNEEQRQTWLSLKELAMHMDQAVIDMASRSQSLQTQLLALGDGVVQLEQLSSELARFNDAMGEQVTDFLKTLDKSDPLKKNNA